MQPFEELMNKAARLGLEPVILTAITVSQKEGRILSIGYDELPWGRDEILQTLRRLSSGVVYETKERFGVMKAMSSSGEEPYTINFVDSTQVEVKNGDILDCETTAQLVEHIGDYYTLRSIRDGLHHTCEQLLHVREYFKEIGNDGVVERIDQIDALTSSLYAHLLKDQMEASEAVKQAGGTIKE